MKKWTRFRFVLIIPIAVFFGCTLAKVDVTVMSERTTLENQILGTYNSLDDEMLLSASVRSVDSRGRIAEPRKTSGETRDALEAIRVIAFHEDDLAAFKQLGWVGENNEGLLTMFEMAKEKPPPDLSNFVKKYTRDHFVSVVGEINAARETIMKRVINLNENLSEKDLPEVKKVFGKINRENALPKEKIQEPDGTWVFVKK